MRHVWTCFVLAHVPAHLRLRPKAALQMMTDVHQARLWAGHPPIQRPLMYTSSDPDDFPSLTPNDFRNQTPIANLFAEDIRQTLPRDHNGYVQIVTNLFRDIGRDTTKFFHWWLHSWLLEERSTRTLENRKDLQGVSWCRWTSSGRRCPVFHRNPPPWNESVGSIRSLLARSSRWFSGIRLGGEWSHEIALHLNL